MIDIHRLIFDIGDDMLGYRAGLADQLGLGSAVDLIGVGIQCYTCESESLHAGKNEKAI